MASGQWRRAPGICDRGCVRSPPLPFPFPLPPSEVGPLKYNYRRSGERCKFPQRGLGRNPCGNRIWCILALKSDDWWHQFYRFFQNQLTRGHARASFTRTDLNNSAIRYKKVTYFLAGGAYAPLHLVCLRHCVREQLLPCPKFSNVSCCRKNAHVGKSCKVVFCSTRDAKVSVRVHTRCINHLPLLWVP